MCFNSRPCERGDGNANERFCPQNVSIHAPARGATGCLRCIACPGEFQFTPLREGRQQSGPGMSRDEQFQFTPLREGRRWAPMQRQPPTRFNSRPCERGDSAQTPQTCTILLFQFTPLREGRLAVRPSFVMEIVFQFTPLREGRPERTAPSQMRASCFNSRPCERGDI